MTDLIETLKQLRRPPLMWQAAKLGVAQKSKHPDGVGGSISALLAAEACAEATRRSRAPDYQVAHHLSLLIALLAQARRNMTKAAP